MKIQKKEIESIISDVAPIVGATISTKETEQAIMVRTTPGSVSFMGVNQEFEIRTGDNACAFGLSEITNDEFLVSGKKFISILKSIKENENISIQHSDHKIFARSDKNRFTLRTFPTVGFSLLESSAPRKTFNINTELLSRMVGGALCAINKNTSLPMFSGILFKISRKILTVIGTDGHMLSYKFGAISNENFPEGEFVIPHSTGLCINALASKAPNKVALVSIHSKYVQFNIDKYIVKTTLVDGTYPDCHDLVSKITDTEAVPMDASLLGISLNNISALRNNSDKEECIRCEIRDNLIRLFVINSERELAESTFKTEYRGDSIDFGFNPKYILNIIKNLGKLKLDTKLEIKYDRKGCRLFVEDVYKDQKDGSFYVIGSLER